VPVLAYGVAWGLAIAIAVTLVYRHVIAFVLGLSVMPVMDLNCFYTNKETPANVMSATWLSGSKPEYAITVLGRIVNQHFKARARIVKVYGDLYYKELPDQQEVLKSQIKVLPAGTIRCQADIHSFIANQLPNEMPFELP